MFTVFESLLKAFVHLILTLLLSPLLEVHQSLGHLLSDLLGGLKVGHELLLVHLVLSFKERLESIFIVMTVGLSTSGDAPQGWTLVFS